MSQKNYCTFENYGNQELKEEPVPTRKNTLSDTSSVSTTYTPTNYQPIEIQSLQHKQKILTDNGLVIVLVHAKWCGPCKYFKPKYYQYAKAHITRCYFAQEDFELGLTEGITAVPSLLIYKRGKLVHVIKGGKLDELNNFIPPM